MPRRLLLLLLLLLPPLAAFAVTPPQPFVARYVVLANGFTVGEMERRLERRDTSYVLETEMYTTGLVAVFKKDRALERSVWQVAADGTLQPEEYRYEQNGERDRREVVRFDWAEGIAHVQRGEESRRIPVTSGALDKLSYQVVLRHDLAQGRESMSYPVVERRGIRPYHFQVIGEETLDTPLGELRTVKVERVNMRADDERKTTFWVAPQFDYMLVQIVQESRGDVFASYLASITELQR